MRYYIIAGEASGDMHAANLVKELNKLDVNANMRGWGGDKMKAQGVDVVKHYRELAFMGFIEVIANLRTILNNLTACKKDILAFKPDVVILVDYPGFNLRIAEFLKENNIRVFYYISPQIWAWKESRVHKIKRVVDKMYVILPFEKAFYRKYDYEVEFTGHPLLDEIAQRRELEQAVKRGGSEKKTVALLPGSRAQEIKTMLPVMLEASKKFSEYSFVVAAAPTIAAEFYKELTDGYEVEIVAGQTYNLLQRSYAALVTSGTATLETALFGVPEIVCYKGNRLSYLIARQLVKVKYISLVNLILDRLLVTELIQDDFNVDKLSEEMSKLLSDNDYRQKLTTGYKELKDTLGNEGASAKAAGSMYKDLQKNQK